jgi:conflict system STAND superfamily ATPase
MDAKGLRARGLLSLFDECVVSKDSRILFMSNTEQVSPPTPKSALDQLKEWKELISFIAVGLASILGGILSEGAARAVSWGAAVVLVAVGGWWVRRSWLLRRLKADQEKLWAERQAQPRRTAFRSLAPFEERDELPGKDRTQQARSIATRITSDDFRFGIVCGDSGCGKTSLLRTEVMRHVRAVGLEPFYLRSPRRLAKETSTITPASERLAAELDTLGKSIPSGECVLILDQFEEWFIEYREPEVRLLIGRFISGLTKRAAPMRIVCAVRREFLVDFHDLSAELSDPTAPNTTFMVRNFTVEQAIDVINLCAAADGLSPDEEFAEIIANDLVEGGEVRPPELQIVCTYLADTGSLSTGRYRSGGGTAGILAHYIKDALDSCRSPEIGARLLRALCDFPARAKRRPKTIQELTADIGSETVATNERLETLIVDHVRIFVLARLLTVEKRRDVPDAFGLMHDYLVGAVELATSDTSTQTEEANQLLRYYLAERRGTIPLFKLRFIRAHADRPLLAQPDARRLVRKSIVAPLLYLSATAIAALAIACGLYLLATASLQWKPEVIARHWPDNESGQVSYQELPDEGRVISGVFSGNHIRIWDAKSAALLQTFENPTGTNVTLSPGADFVILRGFGGGRKVIRIRDGMEIKVPNARVTGLPDPQQWISYAIFTNDDDSDQTNKQFTAGLWSIADARSVREVKDIPKPAPEKDEIWFPYFEFSSDGERLITLTREGNRNVLALYDAVSGQKLANLTDKDKEGDHFAIDTGTKRACTYAMTSARQLPLQLWNLDDGRFIRERKMDLDEGYRISFSRDGSHLVCYPFSTDRNLTVLRASDLQTPQGVEPHQLNLASYRSSGRDPVCWWLEGAGVNVWQVGSEKPIYLPVKNFGRKDHVIVSTDLQRALTWGNGKAVELWDLRLKQLIRPLAPIGSLRAEFTLNDTAVAVLEEGNLCSLFAKEDGIPLAQNFTAGSVIYYDSALRRFHLWNSSGQVVRYVEGRSYFGKFIPTQAGGLEQEARKEVEK